MTSSRHVFEPHSYMKLAAVFTQQYTRLPSRRNTEGFPPPSEEIRLAGSIRDGKPHKSHTHDAVTGGILRAACA